MEGDEIIGAYRVTCERLGEGGQVSGAGEGVFKGYVIETGQVVAVKKFAFARLVEMEGAFTEATSKYTRLKREVENAWKVSGHPNVVTLGDVCFDERREYLCLVMELGEGKDIFDQIARCGKASEAQAASWFHQIATGVAWVHSLDVCHRDLKLENVLLQPDGRVLIADFGMSKDHGDSLVQTRRSIGTLAYLAPELLGGAVGSYQPDPVDIWAMGVMLYVMTCANYPFGTDQVYNQRKQKWETSGRARMQCVEAIQTGNFDDGAAFQQLSPALQDLIRQCMTVDPAARITIEQVLQHPWLAEVAASTPQAAPVHPRERGRSCRLSYPTENLMTKCSAQIGKASGLRRSRCSIEQRLT